MGVGIHPVAGYSKPCPASKKFKTAAGASISQRSDKTVILKASCVDNEPLSASEQSKEEVTQKDVPSNTLISKDVPKQELLQNPLKLDLLSKESCEKNLMSNDSLAPDTSDSPKEDAALDSSSKVEILLQNLPKESFPQSDDSSSQELPSDSFLAEVSLAFSKNTKDEHRETTFVPEESSESFPSSELPQEGLLADPPLSSDEKVDEGKEEQSVSPSKAPAGRKKSLQSSFARIKYEWAKGKSSSAKKKKLVSCNFPPHLFF